MLKACCDCIAAGFREETDAYGAETIQLNGRIPRAPSWPEQNSISSKMFLVPSILNRGDKINVTGMISSDPKWVSFGLITANGTEPDYNNVVAQLELHFPTDSSVGGQIIFKTKVNGNLSETIPDLEVTDFLPDHEPGTSFPMKITVKMEVTNSGDEIEFKIEDSYLDNISVKHQIGDIRYIMLEGDMDKVTRLDFNYA